MIHTVIRLILILLFLLPLASSIDLEITAPEEAIINENISIQIHYTSNELHDVKIFIQEKNEIISKIYSENQWKNPFYYLRSSFPKQTSFTVKAIQESQKAELCVRLRKTGETIYIQTCQEITLISSQVNVEESKSDFSENIEKHKMIVLNSPVKPEILVTKDGKIEKWLILLAPVLCLLIFTLSLFKVL